MTISESVLTSLAGCRFGALPFAGDPSTSDDVRRTRSAVPPSIFRERDEARGRDESIKEGEKGKGLYVEDEEKGGTEPALVASHFALPRWTDLQVEFGESGRTTRSTR